MRPTNSWLCVVALLFCVYLSQSDGAPVKRQTTGWWERYQKGLIKLRAILDALSRADVCFVAAMDRNCPFEQTRDTLGHCRPINELIRELKMLQDTTDSGPKNQVELVPMKE